MYTSLYRIFPIGISIENIYMDEIQNRVHSVLTKIRHEREKQNLSQVQLAARADIAQSFYSGIESMQNIPTLTTIFKIADALGVPASKLLEEEDLDREKAKEIIIQLIRNKL